MYPGGLAGLIKQWNALPNWRQRWCTRVLKIEPFAAYLMRHSPARFYVGLRADEEARAVQQVLLSNKVNYWTGTECREFEKEFAAWCDTRHAIALANGTLALDLALKGLGIGPGDEVIVTPYSMSASVACVAAAGAIPVFADIAPDTFGLDPESVRRKISEERTSLSGK